MIRFWIDIEILQIIHGFQFNQDVSMLILRRAAELQRAPRRQRHFQLDEVRKLSTGFEGLENPRDFFTFDKVDDQMRDALLTPRTGGMHEMQEILIREA